MNALVHVNIDQGIHKVNSKLYEMKNEKKKTVYMEFELVFSF